MELYHHSSPPFTNWVLANGLLREKFVVIDIGCQGGEHPRWGLLGDSVEFYGFDAIREAIDSLSQTAPPGRHFFAMALGEIDGEAEFHVNSDTFSSSFLPADTAHMNGPADMQRGWRTVSVRRLDTLFAKGSIPAADHIKLDCEGFEPFILKGARRYLAASSPICVTTESGFNFSPPFPRSHFHAVNEILAEHRLLVCDVNFDRVPRSSYADALRKRPWPESDALSEAPHLDIGAPGTLNVLFCRDFVAESAKQDAYQFGGVPDGPPSIDQLIKAMINFELHGLMDCAFDIAVHFREQLQDRLDVDKGLDLLLTRAPHARNTVDVVNCLGMIAQLRTEVIATRDIRSRETELKAELLERESVLRAVYASRSWRMTAPLRKLASWFGH
jgi:FkbM family methyltransferase